MAEFKDTMKQWRRMCTAHKSCYSCDICASCASDPDMRTDLEIAKIEEVVSQWAEEYPEPVYQKWWEWLADQGILTCDKTHTNMRYWYALNKDKVEQPIPADIAQKLGLKPKERQ